MARVMRPDATRQAASPWDNFQWLHSRHGKVQSSKLKSRDSSPICSIPTFCLSPPLLPAGKPGSRPLQPQETPVSSLALPTLASWLGLRSSRSLPVPIPSHHPQTMQDGHPRGHGSPAGAVASDAEEPGPTGWLAVAYLC